MTFSIVAWDRETGRTGVAISTKNLAVGALCSHVGAGLGAIATQATTNPILGVRGLRLLAEDLDAEDALKLLLKADEGRDHRQLHLVDRNGGTAAWTGAQCVDWAGHKTYPYFSVAGNMLTGQAVIEAMAESYQLNAPLSFAERLIVSLDVAQSAGGDKRGQQSAALLVFSTEVYPELDLRVDDHVDPIVELRRIYEESQKAYYQNFRRSLPSRQHAAGRSG
jgi:uncharacterized Ntn-hydrolase superfamily protein